MHNTTCNKITVTNMIMIMMLMMLFVLVLKLLRKFVNKKRSEFPVRIHTINYLIFLPNHLNGMAE